MKALIFAAGLLVAASGVAQAQDPNAQGVPPGDGITHQGTDPEGQPCTPAGFNQGATSYPPCGPTAAPPESSATPPPCSRTVTDHCIQTYERGVRRPG